MDYAILFMCMKFCHAPPNNANICRNHFSFTVGENPKTSMNVEHCILMAREAVHIRIFPHGDGCPVRIVQPRPCKKHNDYRKKQNPCHQHRIVFLHGLNYTTACCNLKLKPTTNNLKHEEFARYACYKSMVVSCKFAGSSNGRTRRSERRDWGSIPCPAAD